MEFLSEYGLFLAKAITFIIAFIVCFSVAAGAAMKNKNHQEENIEIEKINERLSEYKQSLESAVLNPSELKALKKEHKNEAKQKKKAAKKETDTPRKRVYVTSFDGDIKASDTDNLRKIISIILTQAKTDDEVVIKLESSGGMVHSYGFAASQLARIKAKNIPLTVCIDHVAASGGYMMACVANKMIAAPFAIIGSIGVIAQLPNFHKLLKKTDIDYEMYTAGEYKRTLTMFAENTDKGREKFIEELEDTHGLFKDYVSEHRAVVDIDRVATGEVWFGKRALDQQLVDELKTSDEYIYDLSDSADVYEIRIEAKKTLAEKLGFSVVQGLEQSIYRLFNVLRARYF